MIRKIQLIFDATCKYVNQPLGAADIESVWEIQRFWYLYQIELLENCWIKKIGSESHYTQ
jgi:hypothetical protein